MGGKTTKLQELANKLQNLCHDGHAQAEVFVSFMDQLFDVGSVIVGESGNVEIEINGDN